MDAKLKPWYFRGSYDRNCRRTALNRAHFQLQILCIFTDGERLFAHCYCDVIES